MIIDLHRLALEPAGATFEGEEPGAVWALEHDADVKAVLPIHYRFHAYLVSGELIATGRLDSDVGFRCSRCGEFSLQHVVEPAFECAREVDASMQYVDLTGEIRETMILAFPSYPLCRDDCKGLCAKCGKNLNTGACDCKAPEDTRWDALGGLSLN